MFFIKKLPLHILLVVGFFFIYTNSTQAACGNIIDTVNNYEGSVEVVTHITDCSNPFNADVPVPFSYQASIGGQAVMASTTVSVYEASTTKLTYFIDRPGGFIMEPMQLFKKENGDFVRVLPTGFGPSPTNSLATEASFASLADGEYTLVLVHEDAPVLVQEESGWKQWLKNLFLPTTVYSYYPDFTEVVAIQFTIDYKTPPTPAPAGASSVLFLPGIQASRLYTEGAFGTENQIWEPNINSDVQKLEMTNEGASVNEVYTSDVISEIVNGTNIHKSFLNQMDSLSPEVMEEFKAFAYDWRYSVTDVATKEVKYKDESKRLLDEILALADKSYTGKVTLIAHSNGGLVAKSLLAEYGDTILKNKIDKLIMIGTPQLGTPKAIGSMLHGLDQNLGLSLVSSANTARDVTKNMPGAYTLLPSSRYFESVSEAVISTDGSELAKVVSTYGEINSQLNLSNFLLNSLNNREEAVGLNEAIVLNTQIFSDASKIQEAQDNWAAPAGVEVYEIVGTGLPTIKGYEYREYDCSVDNEFCIIDSYLKPFPIMTNKGDQTVVTVSSEGYEGDKTTMKVNLFLENLGITSKNRAHKNLTESEAVQAFLDSVIRYPYLSDSLVIPEFTEVSSRYRIIAVHSPVSLLATAESGKQVGVVDGEVRKDITNSQYFELGGSKYVIIPSEEDVEIVLSGTGNGVYTLTVDELDGLGEQKEVSVLSGATTTSTMRAVFSIKGGVYTSLKTDLDGDQNFELEQTLEGVVILEEKEIYNYKDLKTLIRELNLKKSVERRLLKRVRLAQKFSEIAEHDKVFYRVESRILKYVERKLNRYHKKGKITDDNIFLIKKIIKNIKQYEK
ncbi:MAG: hypothetical protein LR008_02120 [Candidatus Pacebacteria bacterium]|nr:hypothetical protein [Candidatus Paceibacterota bacterium]